MGVRVIAGLTCREAGRRKVLAAAVALGLVYMLLYGFGLYVLKNDPTGRGMPNNAIIRHHVLNSLVAMGLYAVNWLVVLISVLAAVDTLSGEIASGTIQSIASKPIERWRIVAGKWAGFAGLLSVYTVAMALGVVAVARLVTGHQATNVPTVVGLMWLESMLLLSVTVCAGTTLSTRATGVTVFGLHLLAFLGGWIEEFGQIVHSQLAANIGIVASLVMPSESLWRRAASELQGKIMSGFITPFNVSAVPSGWMVVYAGLYLAAALALAVRRFSRRDL